MAIWDQPVKKYGVPNEDGEKILSANSSKCPNCGQNLFYDTTHGAMSCKFCGGLFDPATLSKVGSFGVENPEREYDGTLEISAEDMTRQEIVCNACGAEVITDKNTASTVCVFCGSPAVITRRLSREFKPDRIIPFKIDKAKAMSLFEEHCKTVDHLPRSYSSKKTFEKFAALYVPTWIVSSDVEVDVAGHGHMGKSVDDIYRENYQQDGKNYSTIAWGKAFFRLKNVPFDGEKHIADRLIAAAEPFDYDEMVPFKSEYLQGYVAEKYDQLPVDMTDKIYRRLDKYALQICDSINFGYDKFTTSSEMSTTRYNNQSITYALLPVWFMTIEYDGITYQYIVNGQTGKVSGEFPYAKGWETMERAGRKVQIGSISLNEGLRKLIYGLPLAGMFILRAFGSRSKLTARFIMWMVMNPIETLLLGLLIGAIMYGSIEILPKMLRRKQQQTIANLNKASDHEMAPAPNADEYFDTSAKILAYETNNKFTSLESGWSYGDRERFDFRTAAPEVKEQEEDENATEFQKQGAARDMLS